MQDIFTIATRTKLRFDTNKGLLSVEDLWDLPLTSNTGRPNLDDIARELDAQLKSISTVSFVDTSKKADTTLQLKFDLVKAIIDTRLAENTATATIRANQEKKQQILAIMAEKETDGLKGKSLDELNAILATL